MKKQLIINADDFGFTWGVSQGIAEAMRHNVTSTTIMGNCAELPRHLSLLEGLPQRSLGVHLVLSAGAPLMPPDSVPSLVNKEGHFWRNFRQATRLAKPKEVYLEWRAQVEGILRCGVKLTHLDSHHHVHLEPKLTRVAREIAREYSIPAIRRLTVRDMWREQGFWQNAIFMPQVARSAELIRLSGLSYPQGLMSLDLRHLRALKKLPPGIYEMFCHPGRVDDELLGKSSLTYHREEELTMLSSPSFAADLHESGIELVTYDIFRG
ncbi:MAG: ChbG/HpnK family deacetylase [Thermaerobacter sp.]|nr:ChbG/HpnK family deacetylase [Thermaerobacter sp.]